MRRRFPALLASLFLAALVAPTGAGLASDSPSLVASGKSSTISSSTTVLKSPTDTKPAGRRWN